MSTAQFLGIFATLLGLVGYAPYFVSMVRGQTKPHVFSWLIWGTLTGIGFVIQLVSGGGPGAWVTGSSAVVSFIIVAYGLRHGEKQITRGDWITFLCGMAAIPLWYVTKDPLWSVILITGIDVLGFYPTFRKSFSKPDEENAIMYTLSGLKHFIALFALIHFNLTTALYPASLVVMNAVFVAMLLVRRQALNINKNIG